MTLATASTEGKPSARIVLMKSADARGFTFFTNYQSRKGQDLQENPRAALIFYWEALGRQVRIEGVVEKIPAEESDAYFNSRPLENKLSSVSVAAKPANDAQRTGSALRGIEAPLCQPTDPATGALGGIPRASRADRILAAEIRTAERPGGV